MFGPVLALTLAMAGAPNVKLDAGIAAYNAGNRQGALVLLLGALDDRGTRAQRGRARLYIGLIQHDAGSVKDAKSSFSLALRLAPRIRLPASASSGAGKLFRRVRTDLGIRPRGKRNRRTRTGPRKSRPPAKGPNVLEPLESGDVSTARRRAEVDLPAVPSATNFTSPNLTTPLEKEEVPTATWVLGGVGVALGVAAVVFGVTSSAKRKAAFADGDRDSAEATHTTATTHHTISVAGFVGAGLSFGAAAMTLAF